MLYHPQILGILLCITCGKIVVAASHNSRQAFALQTELRGCDQSKNEHELRSRDVKVL